MNAGIVESCGQYSKTLPAGCHCLIPCVDSLRAVVTLKIQHFEMKCDTKTKDNVFISVAVAVQYVITPEKVGSAFYKLTDPQAQIKSYVSDVIRSTFPSLDLDDAFASKETVAHNVRDSLEGRMHEYGFKIVAALITDIDPDRMVKAAMNEINGNILEKNYDFPTLFGRLILVVPHSFPTTT